MLENKSQKFDVYFALRTYIKYTVIISYMEEKLKKKKKGFNFVAYF